VVKLVDSYPGFCQELGSPGQRTNNFEVQTFN